MQRIVWAAALVGLAGASSARADEGEQEDWRSNEKCRLVFFAVLEGLYRDGVSDEVVRAILPPDLEGEERMRHSFVLGCPLCRPAYEAFRAYESRPRDPETGAGLVFGPGLPKEWVAELLQEDVRRRVPALRKPIAAWVEHRLRELKLTAEERKEWFAELELQAGSGTKQLRVLIGSDPHYERWSGYWGCAACLGSTDAAREVLSRGEE